MTGWRFTFNFVPDQATAGGGDAGPLKVEEEKPVKVDATLIVVTHGIVEAIDPPGSSPLPAPVEVTPESPDSGVTQISWEVLEPDQPFNVANGSALAGIGDGGTPAVEPIAVEPIAALPIEPTTLTPPIVATWTQREQAEKFFRRLRDRGLILELGTDPIRGEIIRPRRLSEFVEPIQPDEVAELLRLRPALVAYLGGQSSTVLSPVVEAIPSTADDRSGQSSDQPSVAGKPARPVPKPLQARVRNLIGQLAGNTDPTIEATVCRAISEALNDHRPESLGLYLGLAGDVRRGKLGAGCLQDAFESACSQKARNRGAVFVAVVKHWLRSVRGGATPVQDRAVPTR